MRAFILDSYGGPEVARLAEFPTPTPGDGQVLIKVEAAGLNPVDYKFREGKLRAIQKPALPIILGNELAGTVAAVGAGVTGFILGDRVYARVDKDGLGAFAEFACVNATFVAKMPTTLDFTTAAGLPLAGLTALQCLRDELHVAPGMRIFISGGAGGVGTFALQLAKHLGAHVTTTASSRGEALVRRLGADEVIDYTKQAFDTVLSNLDGAFDLVGDNLDGCFKVVKRGGRVVSIAGVPEPTTARKDLGAGPGLAALFWLISLPTRLKARRHGVAYRFVLMHPSGEDLAYLADLVDRAELEVVIDRVFPFAQIAEAFAYLETGRAKGKVVVQMTDESPPG